MRKLIRQDVLKWLKRHYFLDEIGNVPLHLQSKLLQIIQTKMVTRLENQKQDH
jgi:transcriptional regulator with PAS, ATPase and Fis domain